MHYETFWCVLVRKELPPLHNVANLTAPKAWISSDAIYCQGRDAILGNPEDREVQASRKKRW
jgi:hypothetical protein